MPTNMSSPSPKRLVLKMHVDVTPKTMEEDMVYVGRPSKYENTFKVKDHGRELACDYFERKFTLDDRIEEARQDLYGKRLVCYCYPERCHGMFLARVSNMQTYTGIGSRETPPDIQFIMLMIASMLEKLDYVLYSGGAPGADSAFYRGVHDKTKAQLFVPWNGFQGYKMYYPVPDKAVEIARTLHPVFDKLSQGVQKLHTRNVQQILGRDLEHPTGFVVCWTKDGAETKEEVTSKTGGTGTAIKLASINNIPVFNLCRKDSIKRLSLYTGIPFVTRLVKELARMKSL